MIDAPGTTRTDRTRDVVVWGRLVAVMIVALGSALAIWNAIDTGGAYSFAPHENLRQLIRQILLFVWYGALVLIVAEILSAARGDHQRAALIDWQVPQLTRLLAAVILIAGTAVTLWDIQAMHDPFGAGPQYLSVFSSGPGQTVSDDVRYFLEQELGTYLWQSGLLILLAALVERIRWRSGDPEEEEQPLVATEA